MEISIKTFTAIAEGQTGNDVANTINNAITYGYNVIVYTFSQSDIVNDYLTVNHNKNTDNMKATLFDFNNMEQITSGVFSAQDANTWKLYCPNTVIGNSTLIVEYK